MLEPADRQALKDIPEAAEVRAYVAGKRADGTMWANPEPRPLRDRRLRESALTDLTRLRQGLGRTIGRVQQAIDKSETFEDSDTAAAFFQRIEAVVDLLASEVETLARTNADSVRDLAREIEDLPLREPRYMRGIPPKLTTLLEHHESPHPADVVRDRLIDLEPPFLLFDGDERQLKSTYGFDEYERPPAALADLLQLAQVTWEELKAAAREPDAPTWATVVKRANGRLENLLSGAWRQSRVSIELAVTHDALHVYPYDLESEQHTLIEDRSDGFRSFLALMTFTAARAGSVRPVLLIDEAKRHLHYDAQADLVGVLERQELASKIIYSTHSVACLPEDLGTGVRVVQPLSGDRSALRNGFWTDGGAGFSPLLVALGAGAAIFSAARHVLLVEGPSDALLLPALIRSSLESPPYEPIGFQVAPGLSWSSKEGMKRLGLEGAEVAYLVDGDGGGDEIFRDLVGAGVPSERILKLKGEDGTAFTIEDLVDPRALAAAVAFLLLHQRHHDRLSSKSWVWRSSRSPALAPAGRTGYPLLLLPQSGSGSRIYYSLIRQGSPATARTRNLFDRLGESEKRARH